MTRTTINYVEYSCGNRYYHADGEDYPHECPHDGCDAAVDYYGEEYQ